MAVQYPHIITLKSAPEPTLVGGEWVFSRPIEEDFKCRAEANTQAKTTMSTISGEAILYSYIVYMPKTSREFESNSECILKLSEEKHIKTTIKRHENGQLNSRIWV